MIDGAHVLTPGVLHHGMLALPPTSRPWWPPSSGTSGPASRTRRSTSGYDQDVEDRLFERIQWPADGYRLFEIGHFIGERDWFDGIVESNCVFVPRKLLEQVGGFDDAFSMPGGGYANLDLFERLALGPGRHAGEHPGRGQLPPVPRRHHHQRHRRGRSAGNSWPPTASTSRSCAGAPLVGLDRPIKFVGSLDPTAAKRTRPRRALAALEAFRDRSTTAPAPRPCPWPTS